MGYQEYVDLLAFFFFFRYNIYSWAFCSKWIFLQAICFPFTDFIEFLENEFVIFQDAWEP